VSDMDVAPERTWMYSQRVLEKGTARPLLPRRSTNKFPNAILEILKLSRTYPFFFQQNRNIVLYRVDHFAIFGDQPFL